MMKINNPLVLSFFRSLIHPVALVSCLLLSAFCLLPTAFCQTQRQTKLILPKIVPEAKPVLVPQVGHSGVVWSVAFDPDGRKLASGARDNTVIIWDVETGQAEKTLKGHTSTVWSVAFSPDGKRLASGSWDSRVIIWDVESGQAEKTLKGHIGGIRSVAFSPDGWRIASGSDDKTVIVWDVESGQVEKTLRGYRLWVNSLSFSPDAKKLASAACDGVFIWDIKSGQLEKTLSSGLDRSVAFSPDGKKLAVGKEYNREVTIWDVASGQVEKTLIVSSRWISPDLLKTYPGKVYIAKTSRTDRDRGLLAPLGRVYSVSFNPDGKKLASSLDDATVIIWDIKRGQVEKILSGHKHGVLSVSFSPDGKRLASGSEDGWSSSGMLKVAHWKKL